ncbi:hypothetical protein IU11_14035 [Cellulosimicrobium sp. MM]|nr:hypothetical protein IU11_14035 [Cellulosimicrobium sp. MM]
MQTLAEQVDADVNSIDNGTIKKVGFTIAGIFNLQATAVSDVAAPALTTTFNRVAGHRYRITLTVKTSSSVVTDVIGVEVAVQGSDIAGFSKPANSSPNTANTGHDHVMIAYYTAPSTGSGTSVTVKFNRALGTGVVRLLSEAQAPASLLVEDMGVA